MKSAVISRLVAVAAVVLLILAVRVLPVVEWLTAAEVWVDANPILGPIAYILATTVAVVALTPGWIPMALAGVLFGFISGVAYGTLGVTLGAFVAMLAGRTLARPWVSKRIAGSPKLRALDEALEDQAFLIVFLTRVAMVLPFNILNYAYGVTRVRALTYATATALGMLPVVTLYAYLGNLAEDIGAVLAGEAAPEGSAWMLAGGIVVLVILAFVLRRTVKQVLERKLGQGPANSTGKGSSQAS